MNKQEMVLSGKDRDRLKVLHEVRQGHITQRKASEQLGVSDRWLRKLLARLRQEGDRGIMHRLRGRTLNRRLAARIQVRAVKLVKARYSDFGPTLAAEYLEEQRRAAGEPGDAAEMADRGQGVEGSEAACGGGAHVAAAPFPLGRAGAMGHFGT